MGRVRAFAKTMVAVMFLPFRARDQVFGVLTLGDAWRFWWWCGVPYLLLAVGLTVLQVIELLRIRAFAVETMLQHSNDAKTEWFPVLMGLYVPGLPMAALMFAYWLMGVVLRAGFQTSRVSDEVQRQAAAAMGVYQVAYVLPVLAGFVPMVVLALMQVGMADLPWVWLAALVLPWALAGWGLFCIGRMQTLVSGRGRWVGTMTTGTMTAVAVGMVTVGTFLLVLWVVGMWRIMVESMR
jgi:hypothetical protein